MTAFPDVLFDLRYWLRNLGTLAGGRVFFRIPDSPSAAPFLRLYRTGGAVQANSEVPIQDIRIAIEVWGMANTDYTAVRQTVTAIETACHLVESGILINPSGLTVLMNASVTGVIDLPDPDSGWPRVVVDVVCTVRALQPH